VVTVSFPSPTGTGWYTSVPVTGTVTATDAQSNVVAITCSGATLGAVSGLGTPTASASLTVSVQGSIEVTCTATDSVGNAGNATTTLLIDSVAPTVTLSGAVDGGQYLYGDEPTPTCQTIDATSGVATYATLSITGGANGAGLLTATCSGAYDVAGNPQAAPVSVSYLVVYGFGGFYSPIPGSQWSKGRTIPTKFALTDSAGTPISDAVAAGLATSRHVRARLLDAPGGSALSSAWCTYDRATDRFNCPLKIPATAISGATYWVVAEEDLGTGFLVVPLSPAAATTNPVAIVVK
jgi:hypothetical protein